MGTNLCDSDYLLGDAEQLSVKISRDPGGESQKSSGLIVGSLGAPLLSKSYDRRQRSRESRRGGWRWNCSKERSQERQVKNDVIIRLSYEIWRLVVPRHRLDADENNAHAKILSRHDAFPYIFVAGYEVSCCHGTFPRQSNEVSINESVNTFLTSETDTS